MWRFYQVRASTPRPGQRVRFPFMGRLRAPLPFGRFAVVSRSGLVLVEEAGGVVDDLGRQGLGNRHLEPLASLLDLLHRAVEHDLERRELPVDVVLGLVTDLRGLAIAVLDDRLRGAPRFA